MSASERQICSMNDWTVLGSVANHSKLLAGGGLGGVASGLGRIGREHDELAVLLADRDQEEVAGQALVDPLRELRVDLGGASVAERDPACRRQRSRVLGTTDAVPGEQQLSELGQVAIGLRERRRQTLTVEVARLHEALTERDTFLDARALWFLRRGARRWQRAALVCLRLA